MKLSLFNLLEQKAATETAIPDGLAERTKYERMLPTYMNEWSKIVREQQKELCNLLIDRDELYGQKMKFYKYDDKVSWSDSQLKIRIQYDVDYVKISKQVTEQQYYLDRVKDILDILKGNHFIVQEYNKMKKESEGSI